MGLARAADGVPPLINYQGRLTDDQGQPVASGDYRLAFRLWSDATSTATNALVWGREFEVTVVTGAFNVILNDDAQPASPDLTAELTDAVSGPSRFLGLTVLRSPSGTVPAVQRRELIPRQQLLAVPYALQAQEAQRAATLVKSLADALCPPGSILAFGGDNVPDGWLLCDGQPLSSQQHPRLFAAIRIAWGDGQTDEDPATDFNLPDLRGLFLRGVSGSRTDGMQDPDVVRRTPPRGDATRTNAVGSVQLDEFKRHQHFGQRDAQLAGLGGSLFGFNSGTPGPYDRDTTFAGGSETRPRNAYVHFIIKD